VPGISAHASPSTSARALPGISARALPSTSARALPSTSARTLPSIKGNKDARAVDGAAYPALRDCVPPDEIPLDPVKINNVPLLGQGLGQSIYSRNQMESFVQSADAARGRVKHSWQRLCT
jgi:hypothetical protein